MISFILWTLVVILLGWAAFPILFWLFPHLTDRGYGLAKPAGLLLFGYIYWLLATFQILPNNWTGVAASFLLVCLAGFLTGYKVGWQRLRTWFSVNQWLVIVTEILFILLFAFFALVRAAYPDITGTEKPMELAFINSILRSSTFPPADPWLSGYAISYYYFGYVVVAGIIRLTGTISGVGFNLAIALWFAMTGIGAFSLVFSTISRMKKPGDGKSPEESAIKKAGWALLGPVFLIFSANWEGLLELLHARGVFWNADGQSAFWKWLDVLELTSPPNQPLDWFPSRPGGIWWWRASRVLQDYDLAGNSREIIDEFPFFSLYLADLHPHILSMPYVILACGLALELFLLARSGKNFNIGWFGALRRLFGSDKTLWLPAEALMPPVLFWAAALLLGGLSFLNTWDFPIGVGLCSAAIVLGRYLTHGWSGERIIEFLESGIAFGAAGVILYLPFYIGFASQAGGILPSLAFFTRGTHQWIMFGVMFVPIFAGILITLRGEGLVNSIRLGLRKSSLLIAGLWAAMLLLGFLFSSVSGFIGLINPSFEMPISAAAGQFLNLQGSDNVRDILLVTSLNRLVSPGAWLTLLILLTLVWGAVLWFRKTEEEKLADTDQEIPRETIEPEMNTLPFVYLLVAVGIGLVLFPEFFYLRDQFGWRMNTIFKFYFQTWIFWAMAAAVFSYVLWNWQRGWTKWVTGIMFILSMLAAMLYPFYGLNNRFSGLTISNLNLDGNAYFSSGYPDDTAAINFLMRSPDGVVAEAVGGSYTGYARVSTQSGQPTIIGWPGHESQWRGGALEIGSREPDIRTLYQTNDWLEALKIIQKYQIRYIYLGYLEKSTYRVDDAKFRANLFPAFQNASVTIYKVSDQLLTKSPSS
jgi:YYY domain-containing protein